jgi:hypothetical protein
VPRHLVVDEVQQLLFAQAAVVVAERVDVVEQLRQVAVGKLVLADLEVAG